MTTVHLTISTSLGLYLEMDKWKIKMMMMIRAAALPPEILRKITE
jgi:hypothetical protein